MTVREGRLRGEKISREDPTERILEGSVGFGKAEVNPSRLKGV